MATTDAASPSARGTEKEGGLVRIAIAFTAWAERWFPDAFIFVAIAVVVVALAAAFGRSIAEVGSALLVGGNIPGYTRTLTTAIVLETGKGQFALALALGGWLLALALAVNVAILALQTRPQA